MGTTTADIPVKPERKKPSVTISGMLIRLILLGLYDVFAVWLITNMFMDGYTPLAAIMVIITIFLNLAFLREGMYPLRWMAVGLSLMLLITVYPIIYTVYISFTNYSDGNLLTQQRANEQLEQQQYLPESGVTFSWSAFQTPDGEYALWLVDANGNSFLAKPGEPLQEVANPEEFGDLDADGVPVEIEGYTRLNRLQTVPLIDSLAAIDFGDEATGDVVRIRNLDSASQTVDRYQYDADTDTMTDLATGVVYTPVEGTYTAEDGTTIRPGFWVGIGAKNYLKFFTSPAIAGPLIRVTIWNFVFAFLTVLTTFFLGLFTAMLFNDLKGKRIIRSLYHTLYDSQPGHYFGLERNAQRANRRHNRDFGIDDWLLTSLVYRPYLGQDWHLVSQFMVRLSLLHARLQRCIAGDSADIYSAADVDGAGAWPKFWKLTLPLLLISVGPLLIASFTFNFNNFNVIYLYNEGGPPIAGAPTPVGHTDILISYVFKLAFGGARGADYGFASAISIIIFAIVVVITLFQFKYTNMWEAGDDV